MNPRQPAAAANALRARPYCRGLQPGALDAEFPPLVPLRPAAVGANDPRPAPRAAVLGAWTDRAEEDNVGDWMDIDEDEED